MGHGRHAAWHDVWWRVVSSYQPYHCITCHCLKWRYTEPRFLHLPSPSRIASTLGGPVLWLGRWNRLKFLLRTWATLLNMMKVITFCGNWSRPDNLKERLNFASEKMMRNYRRLQNMLGGRDAVGWYKQLLCQIKSLLLRKMLLYCQMLIFIAGLTFLILPAVH